MKRFLIPGILLACVILSIVLPREIGDLSAEETLRLGAGDDISGFFLDYVVSLTKMGEVKELSSYAFQDCWNNTAQWALRSDEIDLAFYCSHLAKHFVEEDSRFTIYGAAIMNGEVLAKKKSTVEIKKVGLGQKRQVVKEKISKSYPNVTEIVEMNPRTLPYSLEAGQIDGAVLDVTKASLLPEFQFLPLSDEDYISYVLIVRKDILETKNFGTFIKSYNKAVEELQDREKLPELLGMTKEFWEMSQVKFLSIEP